MNYYGVTFRSPENSLIHYGVKGQKHGVRRFQNEDGSLTAEGRDHYGVGKARAGGVSVGMAGRTQAIRSAAHNYRVRKFGKSSAKMLEQKPKKLMPKQQAERNARRKKLIAAAAATAVAAIGIGVAVKQHQKTTRNLIEMAKNQVHKQYVTKQNELDRRVDLTKNERQFAQYKLDSSRTKAMMDVYSRGSAKKALGISGRKNRDKAKAYIRDNNLKKIKTSEIVERRTGRLIEVARKNRRTGRFEEVSEKQRRKLAERMVRQQHRSRVGGYYI